VTHVWAVILGVVQGLAEFLPISSTAHLKLIPWLFGVRDAMLSSAQFDIALHAGSLVAILAALWRDWVDLILGALGSTSPALASDGVATDTRLGTDPADPTTVALRHPRLARQFLGFLLLTSIPGALFGVAFDQKLERLSTPDVPGAVPSGIDAQTFHYAPLVLGIALIVFGIVLWATDRYVKRSDPLEKMTWLKALLIGVAQAVALIPGVSRSGATMTAGRLFGLEREAVARYSFMAAAPIIGGAALFGLRHVPLHTLLSLDWVIGFLAAAISSVIVMRWMLSYIRRHSFSIFMWYRVAFGVLVIAVFFLRP
jgi:undecaprenyl-diphosphatase